MWTILLPITICITVVSFLLVSGWSVVVTEALKRTTSFGCYSNKKDNFPSTKENFYSYNKVICSSINKDIAVNDGHFVDTNKKTEGLSQEDFSIFTQILLFFIVLLGIIMFVAIIIYGNFYSNTPQILRSQLVITLTSLFQMIVFYAGRDSGSSTSSPRALSISAGDVISV